MTSSRNRVPVCHHQAARIRSQASAGTVKMRLTLEEVGLYLHVPFLFLPKQTNKQRESERHHRPRWVCHGRAFGEKQLQEGK